MGEAQATAWAGRVPFWEGPPIPPERVATIGAQRVWVFVVRYKNYIHIHAKYVTLFIQVF